MLQSVSFTKTNNTKERGDKITKHFPHNKYCVVAIISIMVSCNFPSGVATTTV